MKSTTFRELAFRAAVLDVMTWDRREADELLGAAWSTSPASQPHHLG